MITNGIVYIVTLRIFREMSKTRENGQLWSPLTGRIAASSRSEVIKKTLDATVDVVAEIFTQLKRLFHVHVYRVVWDSDSSFCCVLTYFSYKSSYKNFKSIVKLSTWTTFIVNLWWFAQIMTSHNQRINNWLKFNFLVHIKFPQTNSITFLKNFNGPISRAIKSVHRN